MKRPTLKLLTQGLLGLAVSCIAVLPAAAQFTEINAGLPAPPFPCIAWGDYDNDGDLDAIVIGYDADAQVSRSILYRNDAGTLHDSGISFHNLYLGTAAWMDHDNDGDLDLLLCGNESGVGDYLKIVRNGTTSHNDAPGVPAVLAWQVDGTSVVLSWAAAKDQQTPAAALTYNVRVGTTPGGSEVVSPQSSSTGYRRLPTMGNAGHALAYHLRGLTPGHAYYWSVQAVDTGFAGSSFAAESSFTVTAEAPLNVGFTREVGGYHAVWRGTPGSVYHVETSGDLVTWRPLLTATATSGTALFEITDSPAADFSQRFYRAVLPTVSSLSQSPVQMKKITAHAHPRRRR